MKKLIILIFGLLIVNGCRFDSEWNCFGASTPVDVNILNSYEYSVKAIFLEYSLESGYKKIGTLKFKPKENKSICLEYEGPISNGLYIYYNDKISKIKLLNREKNFINLKIDTCFIELTNEIINTITD